MSDYQVILSSSASINRLGLRGFACQSASHVNPGGRVIILVVPESVQKMTHSGDAKYVANLPTICAILVDKYCSRQPRICVIVYQQYMFVTHCLRDVSTQCNNPVAIVSLPSHPNLVFADHLALLNKSACAASIYASSRALANRVINAYGFFPLGDLQSPTNIEILRPTPQQGLMDVKYSSLFLPSAFMSIPKIQFCRDRALDLFGQFAVIFTAFSNRTATPKPSPTSSPPTPPTRPATTPLEETPKFYPCPPPASVADGWIMHCI